MLICTGTGGCVVAPPPPLPISQAPQPPPKLHFPPEVDPRLVAIRAKSSMNPAAYAECERRGHPRVGMTAAQVRASCWGRPDRVNTTTTAAGVREQWVYEIFETYAYLNNGVLTAIQERRF